METLEHLQKVQENFSAEEVKAMQAEEKTYKANVVDIERHKDLKNPYDLTIDRGMVHRQSVWRWTHPAQV